MRMIKKLIVILMAFSMLCSMVACGRDDPAAGQTATGADTSAFANPSGTEIPAAIDDSSTESEGVVLVKDGKPCYTIVCSNSEYTDIAKVLVNGLKQKTGVSFQNLRFDPKNGTSLLVIGDDYNELVTDGERLSYGGYAIIEKDGNLYICGYQAKILTTAVKDLLGQLVPQQHVVKDDEGVTVSAILPRTVLLFYNPDYPITDPILLSAHLSEYRIVVSAEAGEMALRQGKLIAERLATCTGLKPEIVTDETSPIEREIVIGSTNRKTLTSLADTEWSITGEGTKLYVNCGSSYAFDGVYDQLSDIFDDKETVDLSGTTESYAKSADDIRILSYNAWVDLSDYSPSGKIVALADLIYTMKADFVGLQESSSWATSVGNLIAEDYGMFAGKAGGHLPIYYNKNVWQPVTDENGDVIQKAITFDKATAHGYNWAMFEKIGDSSVKVIFGNLHFHNTNEDPDCLYRPFRPAEMETFNAELKRLETEYAGVPMFFTGDYNTTTTMTATEKYADGWENIVGGTQMESGMLLTDDNNWWNAIDHICVNQNATEVVRHRKLSYKLVYSVSDHLPVFIDVRLK